MHSLNTLLPIALFIGLISCEEKRAPIIPPMSEKHASTVRIVENKRNGRDFTHKKITDASMAGHYMAMFPDTFFLHLKEDGRYKYYRDTEYSIKTGGNYEQKESIQSGKWQLKGNQLHLAPKIEDIDHFEWDANSGITIGEIQGTMGSWVPGENSRTKSKKMTFYDMAGMLPLMQQAFEIDP